MRWDRLQADFGICLSIIHILCAFCQCATPNNTKSIARLLNVRPAEVRSFLHGQLPPEKTQDMRDLILKIGIPL